MKTVLFAVMSMVLVLAGVSRGQGAGGSPSTTAPATEPAAAFDIQCNKADDAVTVIMDGQRTIFSATSGSGIGGATIERKDAAWPKQVVLRLHLGALEGLTITCGDVKLSGAVMGERGHPRTMWVTKKPGKDPLPYNKDSPYWTEILRLDANGKPTDGDVAYFEIALPQALLAENAKVTIGWIDAYRE